MKVLKLIRKAVLGVFATDTVKKRAEKKAKKAAKRTKRTLALMTLSFCAGAALTGYLAYQNRRKLAVMTLGKRNIRWSRLRKLKH